MIVLASEGLLLLQSTITDTEKERTEHLAHCNGACPQLWNDSECVRNCLEDRGISRDYANILIENYCKGACMNKGANPQCVRDCLQDRNVDRTALDSYLQPGIQEWCCGSADLLTMDGLVSRDQLSQCLEDRDALHDELHLDTVIKCFCKRSCMSHGGNPECVRNCLEDRSVDRSSLHGYLKIHIQGYCKGACPLHGGNPECVRNC